MRFDPNLAVAAQIVIAACFVCFLLFGFNWVT